MDNRSGHRRFNRRVAGLRNGPGAAGFGDAYGKPVALEQGRNICLLMDAGLNQQDMVNQFAALNPALGPDGAAQVVGIVIRDLCPWHS